VIFPSYAQATRFAATAVVTSGMACVLVLTVVSIFLYRASIVRAGTEGVMLFFPSVLNSIQVKKKSLFLLVCVFFVGTCVRVLSVSDKARALDRLFGCVNRCSALVTYSQFII